METRTQKFSFAKKFLTGEAHYGFWDSVAEVLGFVNTYFIVTALSLTGYGVFLLLLSLYAMFSNALGLGNSVVTNDILRFIGEGKEAEAKRLFFEFHGIRLGLCLIAALFLVFGSTILTRWYSPEIVTLLRPMAVLLVLEVLFSVFKALLSVRLHFGLVASRSSMYKVAQIAVLGFCFFTHSLGTKQVIYSMIAGSVFSTLLVVGPTLRAWRLWTNRSVVSEWIIWKVFAAHGKWDIFQQFTSQLISSIQPWAIKLFINTEAVAVYSIAQTMVNTVIGFLPVKTLSTLVPLRAADDAEMQKIYAYAMKYIFFVGVIFGLIAAIGGPVTIYLLFPKYIPSLKYFFVLLLSIPISALSSVTSSFLVVVRKQKYLFFQKIFKGITALPMLLFVMFFGLWGLVGYQVLFTFLLFYSIYRFMRSVPPGYMLDWGTFTRFEQGDKDFIRLTARAVFVFIRNKIPFLASI